MRFCSTAVGLLLWGGSALAESPSLIMGEYAEARSNHVYTCGCLANSELVTDGREAILAWSFQEGEFRGTPLQGAKAVAVIVGDRHLDIGTTHRKSTLYLDSGSSSEQREAVIELLRSQYGDLLGQINAVHAAPVQFQKDVAGVNVEVAEKVQLAMRPARLPEDAHLGSILWYRPFVPMQSETLGTTLLYRYAGEDFQHQWSRNEPSISGYMGSFTLRR